MHKYDTMTEPELRIHLQAIAREVSRRVPAHTGFIVLLAPFGSQGVAQFVSNVNKADASKWMAETLTRWGSNDYVKW